MKLDEQRLLRKIQEYTNLRDFHAIDVAHELNIPDKRAAYLFDKWERKGWYEWGISVLWGWLTDEGNAVQP